MNLLIFSDTHFTHRFDQKKYEYLCQIISQADRVVINGDFWDSWFTTFDQFVNSDWGKLFSSLKQKNTFYVFGNHDEESKSDQRRSLFCDGWGDEFKIQIGAQVLTISHGYRLLINKRGWLESIYRELLVTREDLWIVRGLRKIMNFLEFVGYNISPRFMIKSGFAKKSNQLMKKARKKSGWFVGGDTHYGEIDKEKQYANSGCILYGFASYIVADEKAVRLVEEKY